MENVKGEQKMLKVNGKCDRRVENVNENYGLTFLFRFPLSNVVHIGMFHAVGEFSATESSGDAGEVFVSGDLILDPGDEGM